MSRTHRTVAEIEAQAGELAAWFENFDPAEANEIPVEEYLLERSVRAQAQCARAVIDAVRDAVASGTSWSRVGEILGMSATEAHVAYGTGSETAVGGQTAEPELAEHDDASLSLDL